MTKIFAETFPNHTDMSKKELAGQLRKIIAKLDDDPEDPAVVISDLKSSDLLDDLELSLLYLYLQTCYAREYKRVCECFDETETGADLPCTVHYSAEYRCLLIDTPVMLGSNRNPANRMQENLVRSLVIAAVRKYEKGNDFDFTFSIRAPFSIGLYRRCLKDQSSTVIPDIDNIEARKIINSLVEELSLDDSYSSLISNVNSIEYVDAKEDQGTSILIVEEGKRNALEREFLQNKRSFSMIRKCR